MTSKYQWQKTEKEISKVFDTERTPFSGSTSGLTSSDTLHEHLFVECKTHKRHAVKTLFDQTKQLALAEGKIPLVILREDKSEDTLWVIEEKDVFNVLKEIDLHVLNPLVPKGSTISKLLEGQTMTDGLDLYAVQKDIDRQIEEIVMGKVLSKDNKSLLRGLAVLSYYVESIRDFLKVEKPDDQPA